MLADLGTVTKHEVRSGRERRVRIPRPGVPWPGLSVALALIGCDGHFPQAQAAGGAPGLYGGSEVDTVHTAIRVSADEVRVTFPPDPDLDWSLPEDPECDALRYRSRLVWRVFVAEARIGPRTIEARYSPSCPVGSLTSLEEVVAASRAGVTRSGMILQYDPTEVEARVEGGSVILILREPEAIVDLFGLRPERVQASVQDPTSVRPQSLDTIPVEYVAPHLPEPDSLFLARSAEMRLEYERGIRTVRRGIRGATPQRLGFDPPFWLEVGDSLQLYVEETICVHDLCRGRELAVLDEVWTVEDTAVAALRLLDPKPDLRAVAFGEVAACSPIRAHGRTPGVTRVRVSGIRGPADTIPSRSVPASTVEAVIVVFHPPATPGIFPRVDRASVGDRLEARTEVFDGRGRRIEGTSVSIRVAGPGQERDYLRASPVSIAFDRPGTWQLTAELKGVADTLLVTVR